MSYPIFDLMPGKTYVNVHTHQTNISAGTTAIQNLYQNFNTTLSHSNYSMGLHPWHLENDEHQLTQLAKYAQQPNVLAIGECGLDRICDTDWDLQLSVFIQQISLADNLQKPLIIHCVRAFDELLQTFKQHPPSVPVIIHGFNKKKAVADMLLAQGYYLSFGKAIMNDNSPAYIALKHTPAAQFFLETDDAAIDIAAIYERAASIRETTAEAIILQLQQNFKKAFNR